MIAYTGHLLTLIVLIVTACFMSSMQSARRDRSGRCRPRWSVDPAPGTGKERRRYGDQPASIGRPAFRLPCNKRSLARTLCGADNRFFNIHRPTGAVSDTGEVGHLAMNKARKTVMTEQTSNPEEGDTYQCKQFEMSLLITTSCTCDTGDGALFSCCGEQMVKSPNNDTSS